MNAAEQLAAYQSCLWGPGALIEIRPLPPDKGKRRWVRADVLATLAEELAAENAAGANLFAGVLPRTRDGGGTDEDCGPGWAVWSDFDGLEPEGALEVARVAGMPDPTLVVNSGHGTHLFWGLHKAVSPEELSALVGDIAGRLESDPTVRNPSRILRLPGFTNHKPPPAPCAIVEANAARRYSFAELRLLVPEPKLPQAPMPGALPAAGHRTLKRATPWVGQVQGVAEGQRNSEGFRLAAALRRDWGLSEPDAWGLLCSWNQRNLPPLPEKELRSLMRSGLEHGSHPVGGKLDEALPLRSPATGKPVAAAAQPATAADTAAIPLPKACESKLAEEFAAEARGERKSLPLPWPFLSRAAGGLRPGTVMVVGGPAGFGKSLCVMDIMLALEAAGQSWALLPLEDGRLEWERRALTRLVGDWRILDDEAATAEWREAKRVEHAAQLAELLSHVVENPRRAADLDLLPPEAVLSWVERATRRARVVAVDPLAQVDFPPGEQWAGEQVFVRQLVAAAAKSRSTVILVSHTIKRPGRSGTQPLSMEDLQGAAAFNRLVHTVMLVEAHDYREGLVRPATGCTRPMGYDRTLSIGKARNGPGRGARLAFVMAAAGLTELGMVVPKGQTDVRVNWEGTEAAVQTGEGT